MDTETKYKTEPMLCTVRPEHGSTLGQLQVLAEPACIRGPVLRLLFLDQLVAHSLNVFFGYVEQVLVVYH